MLKTLSIAFAAALAGAASAMVLAAALASASAVNAAPNQVGVDLPASLTIQVSGGCGPDAWRGPWGHCRNTPYYGRLPNGGYKTPSGWNGCPPGYWHGPWGHCRNTPFHGRLPNGRWV
jgi:hypothetical protein